jgi:molybdopterin-containing oxidoreductase family membrane subunit
MSASDPLLRVQTDVEATLTRTSWRYWLALAVTLGMTVAGGYAWSIQLEAGLGVTGLMQPVMWGCYITSFVYFIGVSHSGTLVSAILYLTRSRLRAAMGRSAEAMTLFAILTAAWFPIIHLGRAWLFFWLLPYPNQRQLWPNFRSPLIWDLFAICSYLMTSALFLYMGMLPDLSILSRRLGGWRKPLYRVLSLGFRGTDREWRVFDVAYPVFAGLVIPLAASVHSVVSWDFAMALVPGWHSTIFAPYFVAGAIFSGVAMVILLLGLVRRYYHLEQYIHVEHFELLAKLLLTTSLILSFVYVTEFALAAARGDEAERSLYLWRATGTYSGWFWLVVFCNSVAPLACLSWRVRRSIAALFVLSLLVNLAMWLERFIIVVTSLAHGREPFTWEIYRPTPIELGICLSFFGYFGLLFLLFIKVFPAMSIAETRQGLQALAEARTPTGDVAMPVRRAAVLPEGGHV